MPKTFRVPIQVDLRGRLATTEDPAVIMEQRITDLLVSYRGEREMRPMHGADLQGFLFSPVRNELLGIKAAEIKSLLSNRMTFGEIVQVTLDEVYAQPTTIRVKVWYRILPGETPRLLDKTISGMVTEETVL
jgi:phage baseplate assembly protein W